MLFLLGIQNFSAETKQEVLSKQANRSKHNCLSLSPQSSAAAKPTEKQKQTTARRINPRESSSTLIARSLSIQTMQDARTRSKKQAPPASSPANSNEGQQKRAPPAPAKVTPTRTKKQKETDQDKQTNETGVVQQLFNTDEESNETGNKTKTVNETVTETETETVTTTDETGGEGGEGNPDSSEARTLTEEQIIQRDMNDMWDPTIRPPTQQLNPTPGQRLRSMTKKTPSGIRTNYDHVLHVFPFVCGVVAVIGMNKHGRNAFYGSVVANFFGEDGDGAKRYNIKHVFHLRDEFDEHKYTVNIKTKTGGAEFREHTRVFVFVPQDRGANMLSQSQKNLRGYAESFAEYMTKRVEESGPAYTVKGRLLTNAFVGMVHKNLPHDIDNDPIQLGDLLTVEDTGRVIMDIKNASSLAELALPQHRNSLQLFFGYKDQDRINRVQAYYGRMPSGGARSGHSGYASGFVPSSSQSDNNDADVSKFWSA